TVGDNLAPETGYDVALFLRQFFNGEVTAFDVDVRLRQGEKTRRVEFRKNANSIDGLQCRQNRGPIAFGIYRTFFAFELPYRTVVVQPHQQRVALLARGVKIGHVAGVKDIEAAVGRHQSLSLNAQRASPARQGVEGEELIAKVHGSNSGRGSAALATNKSTNRGAALVLHFINTTTFVASLFGSGYARRGSIPRPD